MTAPLAVRRLGIVGTGRLGRALALRLREGFEVAVFDADLRTGKQFAKQSGLIFLYEHDLACFADALLLCTPADQVGPVVRRLEGGDGPYPLCVNMATAVDTSRLPRELGLEKVRVVGLKPIGQYTAIQHGLPAAFVSANASDEEHARLEAVFGSIGRVHRGDELAVRDLNRTATRLALRFCLAFQDAVGPLVDDSWVRAALRNVAVGTILDFPPSQDNAYTSQLLKEIAASDREGSAVHDASKPR
jgi:hypothetical protein